MDAVTFVRINTTARNLLILRALSLAVIVANRPWLSYSHSSLLCHPLPGERQIARHFGHLDLNRRLVEPDLEIDGPF